MESVQGGCNQAPAYRMQRVNTFECMPTSNHSRLAPPMSSLLTGN